MQSVMNSRDVGVIEAALHLDFSHEPQELAIADRIGVQDFAASLRFVV